MESLLTKSIAKINRFKPLFERYLFGQINWSNQLISVQGARCFVRIFNRSNLCIYRVDQ